MEIPPDTLKRYEPRPREKGEPRDYKDKLILDFLAQLNPPRKEKGMEELSQSRLRGMLKGMTDSQLSKLYRECETEGKTFSSLFWWKIKNTNKKT